MSKLDSFGCVGTTIKVFAGHYVDIQSPSPEMIDLKSIAAGLSKTCRYGGHCPRFYSVAEHCIHAYAIAIGDALSDDALKAILLHDAAEAYIGDVVKPLKMILSEYRELEGRFESVISERFDVDFKKHEKEIKKFDRLMLKSEKMTMWPDDSIEWAGFGEIDFVPVDFKFWGSCDAESEFIDAAFELGIE